MSICSWLRNAFIQDYTVVEKSTQIHDTEKSTSILKTRREVLRPDGRSFFSNEWLYPIAIDTRIQIMERQYSKTNNNFDQEETRTQYSAIRIVPVICAASVLVLLGLVFKSSLSDSL